MTATTNEHAISEFREFTYTVLSTITRKEVPFPYK